MPNLPTPRRELVDAGRTDVEINRALRSRVVVAPFRGVVVAAGHDTGFLVRCRAALATQAGDAVLSHRTAAVLQGIPWLPTAWSADAATVEVSVSRADRHRRRRGLRLIHAKVQPDEVDLVNGLRVTTVARTLVDLARDHFVPLSRLQVVQLVDGARRADLCDALALDAALARAARLRNVARARHWLSLARDGVDSPKETESRLVLLDRGVPYLDAVEVRDADGLLLAKGDFGDRTMLLWGEYDGYDTHSRRPVFRSDRQGDRWLFGRGWNVFRVVDTDLQRPDRFAREWLRARAEAPARIAALDPRRSPEIAFARRALGLD
jgi:hypothetical protein